MAYNKLDHQPIKHIYNYSWDSVLGYYMMDPNGPNYISEYDYDVPP
jgi:hypothetical protein